MFNGFCDLCKITVCVGKKLKKINLHQSADPIPFSGVIALALPTLPARPVDSFPVVSPVAPSSSSILQQLHHLTLVNGVYTLTQKS